MPGNISEIEMCLRRLRRHGALMLGSKAAADARIEESLAKLPAALSEVTAMGGEPLFRAFHQAEPQPSATDPALRDFARADWAMVQALHKIRMRDRALLLLGTTEGFDHHSIASILDLSVFEVRSGTARARGVLEASLSGRLCMIVEDDLIAMRDLEAEVVGGGFSVAGAARNLIEAYGLTDQIRPDIGIIDLALPEGALAGAEIAARLRERFNSRIVFVTAFDKVARDIARPEDSVVSKPWSRTTLNRAISGTA